MMFGTWSLTILLPFDVKVVILLFLLRNKQVQYGKDIYNVANTFLQEKKYRCRNE